MRILITGGAGSWGTPLAQSLAADGHTVCIYSRDEEKHRLLRQLVPDARCFIGDVRDADRLRQAMDGCDEVYHLAAMKQIDACTYNPTEAVRTNVDGTINVINAAIAAGVARVLCMSTDKAVEATTLYGSTKAVVESLVRNAHSYVRDGRTKFIALRCGNAWASRGSVVPLFKKMVAEGKRVLPITHSACTRYTVTLSKTTDILIDAMHGLATRELDGQIMAPRLRSYRITHLVDAFGCTYEEVGLRAGEKIHEAMVGSHEYVRRIEGSDLDVIIPGQGPARTSADAYHLSVSELKELIHG